MKKGIAILLLWLITAILANFFFAAPSIPHTRMKGVVNLLTVLSFPVGAWVYGRNSGRLAPVICYGLTAGVFCVFGPLSLFYNSHGGLRETTFARELFIISVPVFMALICSGLCMLRRFLDEQDAKPPSDEL